MTTTVLKAADSAEFLGIVPVLAGFMPRQSIVLVPFQGSRAHGAMRLDPPRVDADVDEYVDTAIGLTSRVSGLDAVAVVVYVDEIPQHTPDGMILPQTVVVEELLALASDSGLRLVDALCVMPCGWSSYFDTEPELFPLDEIPGAPDIPETADPLPDHADGVELPVVDFAEKERVGRALIDLADVLDHDGGRRDRENPQALAATVLLDDLPLLFEMALESRESLPPYATAALLWCLDRPPLRDAALLQWATDLPTGTRAFDAQLAYSTTGAKVDDDLGRMFMGQGDAPDVERLRTALQLVRDAAARAPKAARPGPLTLAAWISWALGRATHAQRYLDMVTAIAPEYSLARLLCTLMDAAVLPEWVFQRGSSPDAG